MKRLLRYLWSRGGSRFAIIVIFSLFIIAYFAPLIANSKPLVVSCKDGIHFSAFRDLYPFNKFLKPDSISLRLQEDPDWLRAKREDGDNPGFFIRPPVPYSPLETRLDDISQAPNFSNRHFFGCDDNGRDILTRLIYGTKNSLLVGFIAVGIAGLLGILIGGLGGYFGGLVDSLFVSRLIEMMLSFPTFFLIITIAAVVDPKYLNIFTLMVIIGLTSWTGIARFTRGEFFKLKNFDFINAAKVQGASHSHIITRHLLPNSLAPIIVSLTFGVGGAILAESGLSFLGVGIQPPEPSWGNVLSIIQKSWASWWIGLFPGVMIFISVLSYNLLGDALRDALDPKERS
jgi:peptide/nickel transport system permease protein